MDEVKTFQNSPSKSPWKRPNRVSLSKTKSLKRKSELLFGSINTSNLNDSNSSFKLDTTNENFTIEENETSVAKTRKTLFNRFSINNNTSLNLSYGFNNNSANSPNSTNIKIDEKNDLYSFFSGSKENKSKQDEQEESDRIINDEKIISQKQKLNEKLLANGSLLTNLYSKDSRKSGLTDSINTPQDQSDDSKKETYAFENKSLLPIDWSLKMRIRFLSTTQFSCYSGIKSQHESEALINYSKYDLFYKNLLDTKRKSIEEKREMFKTLFCEATSYWTFPYLPWLNLYPRNVGVSNLSSEPLSTPVIQALSKSWNQSFKSLYNSLKSNQCPYFYLLTQSFTVLFRAQSINGIEEMHAILTPSTKGLRQSLQDINFTMPLMNNNNNNSNTRKSDQFETSNDLNDVTNPTTTTDIDSKGNETNEDVSSISNSEQTTNHSEDQSSKTKDTNNDDTDEDEDDDDDETDEWLEQIGLNSAVNFKSTVLQRNSANQQKDSLFNFDNRPRSTLLFDNACDVQALFNFLLNSKSCIASSGPLTGVPPTLLSPLPFMNSNLQKLKVEQNVVKSLKPNGESLTQYALDFIGPSMPYHVHRLCNLFCSTQLGQFDMIANTNEQSIALNCVKYNKPTILDVSNSNEGNYNDEASSFSKYLDSSELNSIKNMYGIFGEPKAIKTINCKNEKFYCNY